LPKSKKSSPASTKVDRGKTPSTKKVEIFHLGYSRVAQFEDCPRAFKYTYIDGLRTPGSVAMRRGNAYHAALEFLLQWKIDHKGQLFPLERADKLAIRCAKKEKLTDAEIYRVIDAVRFYHSEMYAQHNPLCVEESFKIVRGGIEITGRIDLIQEMHGKLWVIDHKFSYDKWAEPRAKYGCQPIIYQWAALDYLCDRYGMEFGGFAYNIIRLFPSPLIQVIEIEKIPQWESDWWEEQIEATAKVIQAGYLPARPGDKQCSWCGHKELCQPAIYKIKLSDQSVVESTDIMDFEDC